MTRTIPRNTYLLVTRFKHLLDTKPELFDKESTDRLEQLQQLLREMDRVPGERLEFEQPYLDQTLDQNLLGHRYFKWYLNPVLAHVRKLLVARQQAAMDASVDTLLEEVLGTPKRARRK